MKIVFINQFFWPDSSATSQQLTDLATGLARRGHEVSVICGDGGYAAAAGGQPPPVEILRVRSRAFTRGIVGRLLSYLSFYLSAFLRALIMPRADIVISLTTPPLISLLGSMVKVLRGSAHYIWEQDIYPDVAVSLGYFKAGGVADRVVGFLADTSRRHADGILALGTCMKDRLVERGIPAAKISIAENWANGEAINPMPRPGDPDELVLLYSGNFGLAHDIDTLSGAMLLLKDDPRFSYVFVGSGNKRQELAGFCAANDIHSLELRPYVDRDKLNEGLAVGDIGLVTQSDDCWGSVVPSKLYGILAAGRPVLFVGPGRATPARTIALHRCGWHIECGDTDGLAKLLLHLADNPEEVHAAGLRARTALVQNYDTILGIERIARILEAGPAYRPSAVQSTRTPFDRPSLATTVREGGTKMLAALALGFTAFISCLVLTPLVRNFFLRHDIVDRPDGARKSHARAVPRMGGIPIVLSYAIALGLVAFLAPHGAKIYIQHGHLLWALLPAAGLVFLTGLADDVFCLKPWQKLAGQVLAAVLAVSLGARMSLGHAPVWVSILLSIVWLIGCTNAVNLIDGMDGLASGVGLLATITTMSVAFIGHDTGLLMATAPLAGCLLAFLRYNFTPASIFLGDCGSLTIGFMLGCFGLIWSQQSTSLLGMAAPLMALALPLIDVSLAIGRRYLRNVPIFKGDRSHIHHMLLGLGFTTRSATLTLYAVCGVCASFALFESFGNRGYTWPAIYVFCLLALLGISRLRYVEFSAAWKALSNTTVRRAVRNEIYLHELDANLAEIDGTDEYWEVVCMTCRDLDYATASMRLDGVFFEEVFFTDQSAQQWQIEVALGNRGSLVLTSVAHTPQSTFTMAVLHRLQQFIRQQDVPIEVRETSLTHAA